MALAFALLLLSLASAAVMGFAITRGATCMVAAAGELYERRGFGRMMALTEAALWVAAGLSVAALLGLMPMAPSTHAIGISTIAGGALLGIGAWTNGACVFGSVARLGAGEWHFLATPLGFLAGCLVAAPSVPLANVPFMAMVSFPILPPLVLLLLLAFALYRGRTVALAALDGRLSDHVWSPHLATSIIGVTFVVLVLAAGAWTYPEALIQLARGTTMESFVRVVLFSGLLGGAIIGGRGKLSASERRWRHGGALRCFTGGALMGVGSLLIPGGNDNLILVGLPFLQPYAWVAIGTMIVAIWACMALSEGFTRALAPRKLDR